MTDLFAQSIAADFEARAISPVRELGAYEALWTREGATFKSVADMFRAQPGAVPSDFVGNQESERAARLALGTVREAGIKRFGVKVHGAGEYPEKLRDAAHPVELLYYQGNWDLTATRSIAIVGTREPSPEGVKRAAKLARLFVQAGYTVVSGLARGIDTAAHGSTMESGGKTIAVLGTPITASYPPENEELQRQIADKHLLISQVPIVRYSRQGVRGNRLFFPERNITMSALTDATIIVEAGNTSGTLVQARHAILQKRKLFILDSCFRRKDLTWPAKFVERGAVRVSEFEEIVEKLASPTSYQDR
jgi:DNA processing protein